MRLPIVLACAVLLSAQAPGFTPDPPIVCASCDGWNGPHAPFKVFADTYWVGVAGLSAMLITSDAGHILLDGGLPQSAARIDENIRALGFRTQDVRLIVNSHAHYDHAGGIAALQRASGATVAASASGAAALERGEPTDDDPQFGLGPQINRYPAVKNVRIVRDGEVLRVGPLAITAHMTPGHTPGSTTWSWQACDGPRCLHVVYADSLNAVSAPGFRFTGGGGMPDTMAAFKASVAKVAALPCDIVIAVHPAFADLDGKLERRAKQPSPDPFVDPQGCRAYAADAAKRLDARVAEEQAEKKR